MLPLLTLHAIICHIRSYTGFIDAYTHMQAGLYDRMQAACIPSVAAALRFMHVVITVIVSVSKLSHHSLVSVYSCGANLRHLALGWCWDVTEAGLCNIVDNCRYASVRIVFFVFAVLITNCSSIADLSSVGCIGVICQMV